MVDRIYKVDSQANRVQETRDENGRRGSHESDEEGEKKDKDKFDKGRPVWKRLVPDSSDKSDRAATTRLAGTRPPISLGIPDETSDTGSTGSLDDEVEKETSITMSQRLLVLWGVLDIRGRPRPRVIATYLMITVVIILSTVLILGIVLRG